MGRGQCSPTKLSGNGVEEVLIVRGEVDGLWPKVGRVIFCGRTFFLFITLFIVDSYQIYKVKC